MTDLILGRDVCGELTTALGHEWLVTNALGGYACGTVAGANTRRYHSFLMASLAPPGQRTLLVAKVDVSVEYHGQRYALSPNEFAGGAVDPRGFVHLESFRVRDGVPIWHYALADALLEQQIFMAPGRNTSYLRLALQRASGPVRLELKPLVTYRGLHSHGRGARPFEIEAAPSGCRVRAFEGAVPFKLGIDAGRYEPVNEWYWNFHHREEAARGLDAEEDLYVPGVFHAELAPGEARCLVADLEQAFPAPSEPPPADAVLAALLVHARQVKSALPRSAPDWIQALAVAADQFLVRRTDARSISVIAGYPWFEDWGRDTMIALPGLATSLGRHELAARVLRTFAAFIDGGMLPNRFPDGGAAPEYNTADATLWLFHAVHEHLVASPDPELAHELYPKLVAIVRAHEAGTRYGIHMDAADGLLCAGEAGSQLTWMDAKQGDHAFTPRVGKPIEINALWINALDVTARLAANQRDGAEKRRCETLLERAVSGFARFWNAERNCLYDVLDVDGGSGSGIDARIRPNQIFAVCLPVSPLKPAQMCAVVDCCARELLTSHGLRSLAANDADYLGAYAGNPWQRDAAYHQGTVWAWLLGPFARAHYRAYGDAATAQSFLEPMARHLEAACVGSLSEIFEGDAPHTARGCFAQAWSVAEILRTWIQLERKQRI